MTTKPTAELLVYLDTEIKTANECGHTEMYAPDLVWIKDRLAEQQKVIDELTPRPIDEAAKHHELPLILYAPKQPPVLGWWVEEDGKWRMPNFMNGEYMGSMAGRSAIRQPTHYLPIPKALQPKTEVDNG